MLWLYPVFSAILLILAFPRFELGFLAWVALIPYLWFVFNVNRKQAFWGGIVFSLLFHSYVNYYVFPVLLEYLSTWMATGTLVLMIVFISLFYGVLSFIINRVAAHYSLLPVALVVPFLWVAMEYVRSLGFMGYTVGFIGYSQWGYAWILNLAGFYGYWGMAYLMLIPQTLIAYLLSTRYQVSLVKSPLTIVSLVFLVLTLSGLLLPDLLFQKEAREDTKKIALVQANTPQEEIMSPAASSDILERYLRLSTDAVNQNPDLDLIVWPETAVNYHMGNGNPLLPPIKEMVKNANTPLLYGAALKKDTQRHNSIVLLNPEKEEVNFYHKKRLVPFVEYFPFHGWLNRIVDLELALGRFTPGEEINMLPHGDTKLGGIICFESYFSDYTRKVATKGADHLFILTNDGWFDDTIGIEQHAQVAAIRAAETGLGTTQVANTGITLSFNYRGELVKKAPRQERDYFILETDFSARPTVYRYAGEYFLYVTAFISATILICKRGEKSFMK